jgi:uncharacterized protein (TIGR02265 family)
MGPKVGRRRRAATGLHVELFGRQRARHNGPVDQRVVFGQSVEALWKSCGPNPPQEVVRAFTDSGIDVRKRFVVAYPAEQYATLMAKLAEARFPQAGPDERYLLLGRAFMEGYQQTMMGRALLKLLAVLGPRRVLHQTTRSFRSANNYSRAEVTELGPRHFRMVVHPVHHPGWHVGLVTAGLEIAGGKNVRMQLASLERDEASFDITWE